MQCPQCHDKVGFAQMAKHRCPGCVARIYFSPEWRWLRGISCGLLVMVLTYRWYPLEGSLARHFVWCAAALLAFVVLLLISIYLLPPEIDRVPGDGPVRLDL